MKNGTPTSSLNNARAALLGKRWLLGGTEELPLVAVDFGSTVGSLAVLHDTEPAPRGDLLFICWARDDFDVLIDAINSGSKVPDHRLKAIRARLADSTSGPWVHYLESEGGLGGSNVITMEGSDADLYLLLDGRVAPDAEWAFLALLHEELPALIDAARGT